MKKKLIFILVLSLGSFLAAVLVLEIGFRILYPETGPAAAPIVRFQHQLVNGRTARYLAHPFLSYVCNPAQPSGRWGPVNAHGFHGPAFSREKPPGVTRIACIGGSTSVCYPRILRGIIQVKCTGRVEVLNFAMEAWTTAESLVNLCLNGKHYEPDALVIHHAVNDMPPRLYPGFRTDYSHWRTPLQARTGWFTRTVGRHSQFYLYLLWLNGMAEFDLTRCTSKPHRDSVLTPDGRMVPETGVAFESNIRTMIHVGKAMGSRCFLVTMPYNEDLPGHDNWINAIVDHNDRVRNIARDLDVNVVDLHEMLKGRSDCFHDLVHFKSDHMLLKALPIAHALWKAGILQRKS